MDQAYALYVVQMLTDKHTKRAQHEHSAKWVRKTADELIQVWLDQYNIDSLTDTLVTVMA